MQRIQFWLHVLIAALTLQICHSQYSKVQYIIVDSQVSAIANCRISSNAIYSTCDGTINLWVSYKAVTSYKIPTHTALSLSCSKYGSQLEHAYLATLDNNGVVTLWEQISKMFSSYLEPLDFQSHRPASTVTDISVGKDLLALGYIADNIIDIYQISKLAKQPLTIRVSGGWKHIKMDVIGNLALLNLNNTFQYYILSESVNYTKLQSSTTISGDIQITFDYQFTEDQGSIITYLISSNHKSGFIHYRIQNNTLSQFVDLGEPEFGIEKLCDNQRTSIISTSIFKSSSGTVITVDSPISKYSCTTDTGTYLWSQFYVVSSKGYEYFIDCYYSTNGVIDFFLALFFFCCCLCLRICAKAPRAFSGICEVFRSILELFYFLFCWCPTSRNIQEIEDALET